MALFFLPHTSPVTPPCLTGGSRGDSSILVFRRCAADRRLSGVEQNFAACCSQKGKCVKAQYFAIFHDRGPGTKRVVTTTPCSLDATPGSTFAAARRTNPPRP